MGSYCSHCNSAFHECSHLMPTQRQEIHSVIILMLQKRELSSREGDHMSFLPEVQEINSAGIHWGLVLYLLSTIN